MPDTAPATVDPAHIEAVRDFSRRYTRVMGVLEEGLHGSPYPLPEARLLYEIGHLGGARAGDLARDLKLDPGYVSRLIKQLEAKGALTRAQNPGDARQFDLTLTEVGRAHYHGNVAAARAMVADILAPLSPAARQDLVARLATAAALLDRDSETPAPTVLRPHRPGDMGWVVDSQAAYYTAAHGWDDRYEALVAEIVAKFLRAFDPTREACWIAERAGLRVGSVFVVAETAEIAKLRLLYVDDSARGSGLGRLLVETALTFARAKGYRSMRLWTQASLAPARRLYAAQGFVKTGETPHSDFGTEELGETWERPL